MKKTDIKKMVIISLFCALAYICVFVFRIKVSFLTFDAKDAIITVCGFLYGPLAAVITSLVTSFLEFITVSETGIYGFIMNVLSSVAFSVPAAAIYKNRKTIPTATIGLCVGVISMTSVMIAANFLITPFYTGLPVSQVKGMILPLILPFNATKSVLNAGLSMLIYKPLVNALRKVGLVQTKEDSDYKFNKRTVVVIIASLLVIAFAVSIFLLVLEGGVDFIKK